MEVWLVGGVAVVMAMFRVQLGIDRRRSARTDVRYGRWTSSTLAGLLLAGVFAGWITIGLDGPLLLAWLVAVNLVAVAFYGWDKIAAILAVSRVPERTLHLLALAGGSFGAYVAGSLFHHKTAKAGFQWKFWGVVALQAALVVIYARARSTPG